MKHFDGERYRGAQVALRMAAAAWGANLGKEPRDAEDTVSKKLDEALQIAAIRYVAARLAEQGVLEEVLEAIR